MTSFTLKHCVLKLSRIPHGSLRYFSSSKHYINLTDEDKKLVEELISSVPGTDIGMTSFLTGKGITDPILKSKHKEFQKSMMRELTKQFPSTWDRICFFGAYLKNMVIYLKLMNDSKRKLNDTIKGIAIEYNLIDYSFQGVVLTKTLIEMYGNERASNMLSNTQKICAPIMNEPIIDYLTNKVPHHLRYAVINGVNRNIINRSVENEGIFNIKWIDDDIYSKEFEFHVKRCIFSDIGKAFGDTDDGGENNLTYTWFCQFDDKMLPNLGDYAQFEFERNGTLGKGCTHCDFKFKHSQ